MKRLKIDEKWSVMYDPDNNDRPVDLHRHDEFHGPFPVSNVPVAMFYSLLEKDTELKNLNDEMELNELENCDVETDLIKQTERAEQLEALLGKYTDQRDYEPPKKEGSGITTLFTDDLTTVSDTQLEEMIEGHAEKRGFFDIVGGWNFEAVLTECERRGLPVRFHHIERDYCS